MPKFIILWPEKSQKMTSSKRNCRVFGYQVEEHPDPFIPFIPDFFALYQKN